MDDPWHQQGELRERRAHIGRDAPVQIQPRQQRGRVERGPTARHHSHSEDHHKAQGRQLAFIPRLTLVLQNAFVHQQRQSTPASQFGAREDRPR